MANSFLTVQDIAERSLPFLEAQLQMAGKVNRDFDGSFAKKGDTVQVRKPEIFEATDFVEADGVTFGEVDEQNVLVTLDTIHTVDKKVSSKELTMNINDFEMQYIMPATKALAQRIDSKLCQLYKDVPYSTGTAGSTPDSLADLVAPKTMLDTNKAPFSPRYMVLNPTAEGSLLQLDALASLNRSQDPGILNSGVIGNKYGFDISMDQNIQLHTIGTLAGTPLTNAATADSTTIPVDGATAGTTLLQGDIITIAGNDYVVTADVTLTGGSGNVGIYPALVADSNDEAITLLASATNNLAFHRDAFTLVNRPLEPAMGGAQSATISVGGLSIRVTYGYDMQYKRSMMSWDILVGYKTTYPELAVRMLG